MFKKTILENGLRVVSVSMPQVKSAAVLVLVKTGSRYETKKINGISHFLEHMAFKGTKRRPSNLLISSIIDGIGGSFNAFTTKDHTGFYIKAASENLDLILDLLSDLVQNSLIDDQELEKERGAIIEEINMYEDQPQNRVGELYEELLFGDHPLGWQISGTKETVARITRNDVLDYIQNMYHSTAIVVGVVGAIPELPVQKYFGKIKPGKENKFDPVTAEQDTPKSLIYYKKTDQAHVCLGVRGYSISHPDRYPLALLSTIIGGYMSSRLFQEIRMKRGLAYYVSSGSEEYADTGYFVTQAGLRIDAVSDAVKIILEQFDLLKNKPPSLEELRRAKDYWRGKMVLSLEDSFRNAAFYATQELLEGKIETPDEVMARVDAVTTEDIQRVAKNIFLNKNLNLAIIGPFKENLWKELSF
ncbi:MAG: pitrilysin family protein [Patescibacteria group bacterium]